MSDASGFSARGDGKNSPAGMPPASGPASDSTSRSERRSRRRAMISAPVRVRGVDVTGGLDEISTTVDVSRSGFLFVTSQAVFSVGMEVAVTFPYSKSPFLVQAEQPARVARVTVMPDGQRSVAIALGSASRGDLVDAAGHRLEKTSAFSQTPAPASTKPLVLAVDADPAIRDSLKTYLTNEGYEVIALASAAEAHEVLRIMTPALLIAEIEGEDLPGYELCAHVKTTPRLRTIPVVLLTRSAYPSDYANAHSLGAVVCMAKPFRQDRMGHVVRLLAPTPQAKEQITPTHAADPTRRGFGRAPATPVKNSRRSRR